MPPPTPNLPNFYLTTTFNPGSPNLKGLLTKNWDLVSLPPYDLNIDPTRIKVGHRRCPNLKEKLCSATISYPPTEESTTVGRTTWDPKRAPNKCKTKDCQYCALIQHHGRVISHITNRTYYAPLGTNCKSNNLVYLITCKKCLAQYVGETFWPLHKRMYEHLYSIRTKQNTPVGIHFNGPGHDISHIQFEVASFVYSYAPPESDEGKKIRLNVEKLWIHRMKTNRPPGLNILG